MAAGHREGSRPRRAVVRDLAPSALLVAVAAALDGAVVHEGGTLGAGGALPDAAAAVSALGIVAVLGVPGSVRNGLTRRAGIREVDAMTGGQFEQRLAVLFEAMGYAVRHTGQRGDFGADLVLERGEERIVAQAKRYHGAVGIEAVQQVVGAARYYGATGATVVTNSTCTPAARALASASGVDLVERDALVRLLVAHPEGGTEAGPLRALARQLLEGAHLCAFAAGTLTRLAWWLLRSLARMARALSR